MNYPILADHTKFSRPAVNHREVIDNPAEAADRINAFLDGGLDAQAMASVLKPDFYRQRTDESAGYPSDHGQNICSHRGSNNRFRLRKNGGPAQPRV